MSDTKTTYSEEIELAKGLIGLAGSGGRTLRTDQPQKLIQLEEVRKASARINRELAFLKDEERQLIATLLPDEERERLAQLAIEIRDGTLPAADWDVEVTPCPDWCSLPEHDAEHSGKYHEGAWLHFRSETGDNAVYLSVALNDDGQPAVEIECSGRLTLGEARRLADGFAPALTLCERLGGAA